MKVFYSFLVVFFVFSFSSFSQRPDATLPKSQGKSRIIGVVFDKKSKQPVEYATVALLRERDLSVVTGVVTNEKGAFQISGLQPGFYKLRVQFIGYKTFTSLAFELTTSYDAGNIIIEEENTDIAEVTVSGQRAEIESRIDKKIISVDPTLASSGTAVDVLQRVPSVTVDQDGNVSMRGSSNVTILMDGRQSGYTSLDQIPASVIDRVEVVTNPSARYDASGIGGIINIITKKNTRRGMNGLAQLNAGTNNRYNGNFSINYGIKKWNFFVSADGRAMQSPSTTKTEYFRKNGVYSLQESNDFRKGKMGGVKLNIDYRPDDSNTISFSSGFRGASFNSSGMGNLFIDSTLQGVRRNKIIATSGTSAMQVFAGGVEYKHIFPKKEHEFVVAASGASESPESSSLVSKSTIDSKNGEFKFDYTRPLTQNTQFSTGSKYMIIQSKTNNSAINRANEAVIQDFAIIAGYMILSQKISKLNFQAGMRLENTEQSFTRNIDSPWKTSYLDWFPSGGLGLELSNTKNIQWNYSRRINRPFSPQLLMPSVNYSDTMNLSRGNPQLKPEYINALELSYIYSKQPLTLTTTLFYRQTTGTITKSVSLLEGGKTMSTYLNGNSISSFGFEQVVLMPLSRKLRTNLNFSLFGIQLRDSIAERYFGMPFLTGMAKCNVIFTPFKSLDFSANVRYNAPILSTQGGGDRPGQSSGASGLVARTWQIDFSVKKEFFDGKLATSIRVQDIFNGDQIFSIHSYAEDFESRVTRTRVSRTLYFGLSYKLNEGLKQNKKRQQEQVQDEF